MSISITSISCHTCGAPNTELYADEFVCSYCGTRNILTARFQHFVERNVKFFSGPPSIVYTLSGLVHAIERIRSYTTFEINKVITAFQELQQEETALTEQLNKTEQALQEVQKHVEEVRETIKSMLSSIGSGVFSVVFAVIITLTSTSKTSKISTLIIVVMSVFVAITILLFPFVLIHSTIRLWQLKKKEAKSKDSLKRVNEESEKLRESHISQGVETIRVNHAMIAEIRNFIRFRNEFAQIEERVPIGVRMDEVLGALNDMQFGAVIEQLTSCADTVETFVHKYALDMASLLGESPKKLP